jgi:thiosulfate dehydrogenase
MTWLLFKRKTSMQQTIPRTLCLVALTLAMHASADETDDAIAKLPEGPERTAIMLGRKITFETPRYLPDHVKSGLSCANCHIDGGTRPYASPWYGVTGVPPKYSARSGTSFTLERQIDECFRRAENGTPLARDSVEMKALIAYMAFLSRDIPPGQFGPGRGIGKLATDPTPDPVHGRAIYVQKCAACHGSDGAGVRSGVVYTIPPLWGSAAINIGSSMARVGIAATFIKHNMPLGAGGSLSDQEAVDVASYVIGQPRPDYPAKAADWPYGGKPKDARY